MNPVFPFNLQFSHFKQKIQKQCFFFINNTTPLDKSIQFPVLPLGVVPKFDQKVTISTVYTDMFPAGPFRNVTLY